MTHSRGSIPNSGDRPGELLRLTGARPRAALARARAVLARHPRPEAASVAHHAAGVALREAGELDAAARELRAALRLARSARSAGREADVLTTLGTVLIQAGSTKRGLAAMDAAARSASGRLLGQVLMRRGGTLQILGRYDEALTDLDRALALVRGERVWEARTRNWRGLAYLGLGATRRADAEFAAAERLFAGTGQDLEIAFAAHNRALVAFRSGDLPGALQRLAEAATRYAALDVLVPDVAIDRCAVLLAAGLPAEALAGVDDAAAGLGSRQAVKKAELMLAAARAALAAGLPDMSAERAVAARRLFARQRRAWWHAHATLLLLQARYATASRCRQRPHPAGLAAIPREAQRVAVRLAELRSDDTPQAWLLAGRAALALSRTGDAERYLTAAAAVRRRKVPALARAAGWLAEALRAEANGDSRRVFAACRHGFALLDEHRLTLGASELRARATSHGAELAAIAQRAALRSGRPRLLLEWSERWRATAVAVPVSRLAADPALRADLAALREITSRLDRARAEGAPAPALHRERTRLEAAIRARALVARGASSSRAAPFQFRVDAVLDELGDGCLAEIVAVDGELHVLVCGGGRVRRFAAGSAAEAAREVDFARFELDRLARGRLAEPAADALRALETAGRRLEAVLFGAARDELGDGTDTPLVVVPPGALHAVPWGLLPSLRDRVLSVSPSARAWLRARSTLPFGNQIVLVHGPGLGRGRTEVRTLAAAYDGAIVLGDGTATAGRVLAAAGGARLAHIAAHGTFRADSPLFSALRLDDGPLTVFDVEGLDRAPYQLILPACESAVHAAAGADELLGLAAALLPRGTAGIVASVVRVNDEAATPLMLALHRGLQAGETLAQALRDARRDVAADPFQQAAGWSFIALGA